MIGLLVGNMSTNVLAGDLNNGTVGEQENVEAKIQENTEAEENIDIRMDEAFQEDSVINKEIETQEVIETQEKQVETYKETRGSSKGQAEQIVFNKENVFSIHKIYDYDWKKIVLPSDGYIDISVDKALIGNGEKSIDMLLENEDGSIKYLSGSSDYVKNMDSSKNTWRVGLGKGTYYLKWTSKFSMETGEVNLKYNVKFTETKYFEKEKNDNIKTATSMEFGQAYNGILNENNYNINEDYYSVDISTSDIIVNLKGSIDENFTCYLYDSVGGMVNRNSMEYEDGGIRKNIYKNLGLGKYYIKIYNNTSRITPYEIKVEGLANGWSLENGIWYYYESGERVKGEKDIGNKIYYFDDNGAMQTEWIKLGAKWYFYNEDGSRANGWLLRENIWYYLDLDNGEMVTGNRYISGKMYYFKENGAMSTDKGWVLNSDGCWNYLNGDGTLFTGWLDLNGTWYYMEDWGDMVCNGVYGINETIYYFNANGDMNTTEGWKESNGIWYYSYGDGTVHCGWKKVNGYWYYMNEYGMMETGWKNINGKRYFFMVGDNNKGVPQGGMVTGPWTIDGTYYYFDSDGALVR